MWMWWSVRATICRSNIFGNDSRRGGYQSQFTHKIQKTASERYGSAESLIGKTVTIAIEKGIIKSKSIIVDATHTLSRSNPFSTIEVLRERSKLLRKTVYQFDEEFKTKMPSKTLKMI